MTWLTSLLSECGETSAMRVVFIAGSLIILGVWGYVSVKTGTIQPIPEWALAILGAAKVGQKTVENKDCATDKAAK